MGVPTSNLSTLRQSEFEVSLVYTVSSQAARATETVSKNKQKTQGRKIDLNRRRWEQKLTRPLKLPGIRQLNILWTSVLSMECH